MNHQRRFIATYTRLVLALIALLGVGSLRAQLIDFETIPGGAPLDGLTISNQFQATVGVSFTLEDAGGIEGVSFPVLAQVGPPLTAFAGVTNVPGNPSGNDQPHAAEFGLGQFFLTDDTTTIGQPKPLIINYGIPTAEASGVIIDIDGVERWEIQARDASRVVIETIVLTTTTPNTGEGLATQWSFNRPAADIHSIRIEYTGGVQPGYGLAFDRFSPLAGAGPIVITDPATGISLNGATLNGQTNPSGFATTALFQWGTSPTLAGATSTTAQNVGAGTSLVPVSEPLTGLLPHTTYYFRIVATNSFGTNEGSILSFTTGNTAPVADAQSVSTPEDTNLPIVLTGSDADLDPLTYSIVAGPTNGSLTGTPPNVTYVPAANYNGPDSFTFKVNDGFADSLPATVNINVTPMNDAPIADDQTVSTPEETPLPIVLTASDIDLDSLTYSIVAGPSNGSLSGTPPNVTYTPALNYTGPDSFTFKANDGTADSNIATVNINVTPANDPPVLTRNQATVTNIVGQLVTNAGTWSDPDIGDIVTVTADVGTLVQNVNGTWTWSILPLAPTGAPVLVTVTANDGNGGIAQVTFTYTATTPGVINAGPYSGFLLDGLGAVQGSASVYVTPGRRFSGAVTINGRQYRFHGVFIGNTGNCVTQPPDAIPVNITGSGNTLTVTVQGLSGLVVRSIFGPGNPAPQAGNYSVVLEGGGAGVPAGHGYGVLRVSNNGQASLNGRLANNLAYTAGTVIRADASMSLWLRLPAGQRCFAEVRFQNRPTDDLNATMLWQDGGAINGNVPIHGARIANAPVGLPMSVNKLGIDGSVFNRFNVVGNTWYFGTLGQPAQASARAVNNFGLFRGVRGGVPFYWIGQAKRNQGFGYKTSDGSAVTLVP